MLLAEECVPLTLHCCLCMCMRCLFNWKYLPSAINVAFFILHFMTESNMSHGWHWGGAFRQMVNQWIEIPLDRHSFSIWSLLVDFVFLSPLMHAYRHLFQKITIASTVYCNSYCNYSGFSTKYLHWGTRTGLVLVYKLQTWDPFRWCKNREAQKKLYIMLRWSWALTHFLIGLGVCEFVCILLGFTGALDPLTFRF